MSDSGPTFPSAPDLYATFEQVQDIALFVSTDPGEIDHVSTEFEGMYGVSADEVTTDISVLQTRLPADERDRIGEVCKQYTTTRSPTRFEHRVVDANNEERWVRVHITPVSDEPNQEEVLTGIVVDITEEKQREEQLVVLNRLLRHDIRNDMAVINGWLDELNSQSERTADIVDRVHSASEQVLELTEISHKVLEVTVQDGAPDLESVNVTEMVGIILQQKRELHPQAEFNFTGTQADVAVSANALLSTVIRNLVQNAVVHNDNSKPTVSLELETNEDTARLRVSDNGSGVDPVIRDQLFEMGVKGPKSRGTGLGLHLCRQILDTYDGEIWYDPSEDGGTTFVVEIPLLTSSPR